MSLVSGQSLSFYEILGPLGAGAMGEVYRARDTRLGREVAIKVLPEHFADDEERLRRFEREARSLASLNHPCVAQIHGVDQVEDTCFLVLELVPGETLEDRIARGPLPVAEAIDVCARIAEGLEAAHEAGVIHRDLKPANVRITSDGKVKVLDFGLAKPTGPDADGESTSDSVLSTEAGRVLGTPTYMAPEQARGRPIDRRVDVWAFGCVLYECLTGRRAFEGETLSDVLASVLEKEPDLTRLPAATPPHVRALVTRCLEKDVRRRQRDMGDVWLELTGATGVAAETTSVGASPRRVLVGIGLALAAGAWLGFTLHDAPEVARAPTTYGALPVTHGLEWDSTGFVDTFAVSSDGESVVYVANVLRGNDERVDVLARWRRSEHGTSVLWEAPIRTGLGGPFFSPEGDWVYFLTSLDGSSFELRRISAARPGEPEVRGTIEHRVHGVDWAPDGALYFGTVPGGIYRMEIGGTTEPVTTPVPGVEWLHRSPDVLPDGESLLYVVDYEGLAFDVRLRSLRDEQERVLVPGARWARFVEPDVLLYCVGENVMADGFDPVRGELDGAPVQLAPRVEKGIVSSVDVSRNGTLVYSSPVAAPRRSVRWVHRDGSSEESGLPTGLDYAHVAYSPLGTHAALNFGGGFFGGAIRVWDFSRSRMDPPLVAELARHPTWLPDGRRIAWYSSDGGILHRTSAAGGALPEQGGVFEASALHVLRDDRVLFCSRNEAGDTGFDLFLAPFEDDARVDRVPIVTDVADQVYGVLSSDETKLAYVDTSDPSMPRLFVTRLPVDGPGQLATPYGGEYPRWNRDGDELFYCHRGNLFRISVTEVAGTFEFSEPILMHSGVSETTNWPHRPFDAAPDGERVLVLEDDAAPEQPRLFVVTNLLDEIRARQADAD